MSSRLVFDIGKRRITLTKEAIAYSTIASVGAGAYLSHYFVSKWTREAEVYVFIVFCS